MTAVNSAAALYIAAKIRKIAGSTDKQALFARAHAVRMARQTIRNARMMRYRERGGFRSMDAVAVMDFMS